ncbi:hypothetical protein JL722_11873 [Aureococcus anophagefferens]|nr:hypothetical protein JL722_11873 [Aureococcus anophagefferens]
MSAQDLAALASRARELRGAGRCAGALVAAQEELAAVAAGKRSAALREARGAAAEVLVTLCVEIKSSTRLQCDARGARRARTRAPPARAAAAAAAAAASPAPRPCPSPGGRPRPRRAGRYGSRDGLAPGPAPRGFWALGLAARRALHGFAMTKGKASLGAAEAADACASAGAQRAADDDPRTSTTTARRRARARPRRRHLRRLRARRGALRRARGRGRGRRRRGRRRRVPPALLVRGRRRHRDGRRRRAARARRGLRRPRGAPALGGAASAADGARGPLLLALEDGGPGAEAAVAALAALLDGRGDAWDAALADLAPRSADLAAAAARLCSADAATPRAGLAATRWRRGAVAARCRPRLLAARRRGRGRRPRGRVPSTAGVRRAALACVANLLPAPGARGAGLDVVRPADLDEDGDAALRDGAFETAELVAAAAAVGLAAGAATDGVGLDAFRHGVADCRTLAEDDGELAVALAKLLPLADRPSPFDGPAPPRGDDGDDGARDRHGARAAHGAARRLLRRRPPRRAALGDYVGTCLVAWHDRRGGVAAAALAALGPRPRVYWRGDLSAESLEAIAPALEALWGAEADDVEHREKLEGFGGGGSADQKAMERRLLLLRLTRAKVPAAKPRAFVPETSDRRAYLPFHKPPSPKKKRARKRRSRAFGRAALGTRGRAARRGPAAGRCRRAVDALVEPRELAEPRVARVARTADMAELRARPNPGRLLPRSDVVGARFHDAAGLQATWAGAAAAADDRRAAAQRRAHARPRRGDFFKAKADQTKYDFD